MCLFQLFGRNRDILVYKFKAVCVCWAGQCVYPGRRSEKKAEVFPVKTDPSDGSLWVGFTAFNEQYFKEPDW